MSNKCIRNRQGKQYWSTSLLSLYLIIFVGLLVLKKKNVSLAKAAAFFHVTCHGKNMLQLLFFGPNSTLPFLFDTCSIFIPVNCQPWQGSCYISTYFVHLKISKFSRFFFLFGKLKSCFIRISERASVKTYTNESRKTSIKRANRNRLQYACMHTRI